MIGAALGHTIAAVSRGATVSSSPRFQEPVDRTTAAPAATAPFTAFPPPPPQFLPSLFSPPPPPPLSLSLSFSLSTY